MEDENLAKASIVLMKHVSDVAVVSSKTEKFSAVTDRLREKKLIVYNHRKLTYYGEGKVKLVKKFKKEIDKQEAYYGGDENGYFGFVEDLFTEKVLKEKMKEVIENV